MITEPQAEAMREYAEYLMWERDQNGGKPRVENSKRLLELWGRVCDTFPWGVGAGPAFEAAYPELVIQK